MIDPSSLAAAVARNVVQALEEDVGAGDVSAALIDPQTSATARIITRQPGVFCGLPWVQETINQVDAAIELQPQVADGDQVVPDQVLFYMTGPAASMLTAERTLLNFVQLLSGTATKTAHYCALIAGTDATLLDTRKTIPGLRLAQKYAVTCGGGQNHRIGLFDAYLLKENHIAASGSIGAAVQRAREAHPGMPVEVEVENLDQLDEAMNAGADIAMVDNFSLADTVTAVQRASGRIKLEASGGIDENTITEIAATGVDYISIGDLTKSVEPLDLSMRLI